MLNRPSKEELAERQRVQDSLRLVQITEQEAQRLSDSLQFVAGQASSQTETVSPEQLQERIQAAYGTFASAAQGDERFVTLENEKVRLTLSTRGGVIKHAELLEYKASGDSINPLSLFRGDESAFGLTLITANNRILQTANLFFTPVDTVLPNTAVLRLHTASEDAWLDFVYELSDNYMVHLSIEPHNMQTELAQNINSLELQWRQLIPQQEQGRKFEERYAQLQYMLVGGDIEKLSESKDDNAKESTRVKWIAYKDQFFSTVMIADDAFSSTQLTSSLQNKNSGYIKEYTTNTSVPFDLSGINEWLVIPMFDLFTGWGLHIGIVILLMTIVIKLIILPFVFVSYKSSAKMKALKPQLDAINEKYPAEKMQERQQATMQLYQQAGVNPMSGCLPMLFQFPVLMAMFWFLPTAIELRGKSLFWADDLSTYDAVFHWGFNIPLLGDHLSLFCLLMTICNIAYTYITMQSQATDPNMKFMKYMMYAMPLMFLFIFNDYAAGLSYYYLVSLFITILQTMIFRWALDDEKMLREMEENKKKKAGKPKSGFMARLEAMQREQQRLARENAKAAAKRR